jgi:hypothetical protein
VQEETNSKKDKTKKSKKTEYSLVPNLADVIASIRTCGEGAVKSIRVLKFGEIE